MIHRVLLALNFPVMLASIYLVAYAFIGLWHPDRLWLRPVFVAGPIILAAWFAVSSAQLDRQRPWVAFAMDAVPIFVFSIYLVWELI